MNNIWQFRWSAKLRKTHLYRKEDYRQSKTQTGLTPIVPKLSGFLLIFFLQRCLHNHLIRYHRDFGLGMTLKGVGRVPPSSK